MFLNLLRHIYRSFRKILVFIIKIRLFKNSHHTKLDKILFWVFKKINTEKFSFSNSSDNLIIYGEKPTLYLASLSSDLDKSLIKDRNFYLLDWVGPVVREGSIVLDIGANTGVFGLSVANMFPQNQIFCFEPHQVLSSRLLNNIQINKLQNISVVKKVVSDVDGFESFYAQDVNKSKNHGLSSISFDAVKDEIVSKIDIESIKIDTFVRDLTLAKDEIISFIKIDVQGAEQKVLAGAQSVIKKYRPIIIFEHEDQFYDNPSETKAWLQKMFAAQGYKVMLISKNFEKVALPFDWSQDLEVDLIAIPTF